MLRTVLLALVIFLGNLTIAYAQEPDGETPVVIDPTGQLSLTFKQLGYQTDKLNQDVSTRWYKLVLPNNFQISATNNYLDLITNHFPPVPDKPSALKVELNGRLLSTTVLTSNNAISNTIHIDLPENLLQTGANSLRVDLDTSRTCEERGAGLDVLVDETSLISFGYQQTPYPADLSLYPLPFTEAGLLKAPVTIVLPDQPTSDDLSAAATIAAGLGQKNGVDIAFNTVVASELNPDVRDNSHLIVIGRPDDNALISDLDLPLPIDETVLKPDQGILEEIVSPWNEFRLVLVVSGLEGGGVVKAGNALNRQAHFLGMRGPVAVVVELGPLPETTPSSNTSMTLASLGQTDQIFYGAAPQESFFDFTLPPGWQLQEYPSFTLKFAHADILDPEASILDIKLNNVPLVSALLDKSNATEGEVNVSLPVHLLRTGNNRLRVGVDMNLPEGDKCRDLKDQRLWTVISSGSELVLPYDAVNLPLDLSLFPYPFSQSDALDRTVIVIPDQADSGLYNDLVQLAVRLGSPVRTKVISLQAVYVSDLAEDIKKNSHLILLGRPSQHGLLREVNAYLPQPFMPDNDFLEPLAIDSVAFAPASDRQAGLLEIIASPWNEKYGILAVTGTTDEGPGLATQTLLEQTNQLQGNLAVVEPTFDPFSTKPKVSTYSIDTRPSVLAGQPDASSTFSDKNRNLLAERWWK